MTNPDPAVYAEASDALRNAQHHHAAGNLDDAETLYRRALVLDPERSEALQLLGVLRREQGDLAESATLLDRAAQFAPESADIWLELTRTLHDLSNWPACTEAAAKTLALDADCIEADLIHATALFAVQKFEAATTAIERVVRYMPNDGGIQLFHARCLMARKLFTEAQEPAKRAATLLANSPDAQFVLGASLKRTGQNEDAEAALQRCLALVPAHHEALNELADVFIARGDTQSALACLRTSHAASPFNLDAISGLCFYTAFDPHSDAAALFDLNRAWSRRLVDAADSPAISAPAIARADDRIRIAYLAYDLLDHVTSWFLEPVLARHDHDRFHVTGYYGNETTDHVTARLGGYVESWQDISRDTIAETAARIRRDEIDIFILASFFRGKDRRVLAYRSAPVQVGYHNRVASTGFETTDYIITEPVSDPIGRVEAFYTEALVRLTNHNVYLPPPDAPTPLPPPCLKNGYVTFGSFNNHAKIGDDVIAVWARILNAVPNARLILRSSIHFGNQTTRDFYQARFVAHGVDATRLEFQGMRATRADHLSGMQEADLTLDPFPCNGGTTSCEALWMGLPLVTMESETYMGRQGASYLAKLGLTDLIAHTATEYIDIAQRLALNTDRLANLRKTMRPIVEREIFNYQQHVLELETAYNHMMNRLKTGLPPASFMVNNKNTTEIT
ncbi:MAG: tetratricopeptide repeat protein [Alphaproteobacteria bacterium]|nr:tetratricopeptide repeat protein [Alphaproteobacteria bacterium]